MFQRSCFLIFLIFFVAALPVATAAQQPLPPRLQPPPTEKLLLQVHAKGAQVYTCNKVDSQFAWVLSHPDAELFASDGKLFGKHSAGPSWTASNDSGQITGKAIANVPSPEADSIPWLLVRTTSRGQPGVLASVTFVQRLNTKGVKLPPPDATPITSTPNSARATLRIICSLSINNPCTSPLL